MKQIFFKTIAVLVLSITLLPSCYKTSCYCSKNLGCKTLYVKNKSTYDITFTKVFCSQTDYYSDKVLEDSVNVFYSVYETDSTWVYSSDSIYKYEIISNLATRKTAKYTEAGYFCECSK